MMLRLCSIALQDTCSGIVLVYCPTIVVVLAAAV